jgi:pentalenolactone F synthase
MSVLEALEAEPDAVPTCYRDMYTAYEMLPPEIRAKLEYKQTVNFDPRRPDPVKEPRLCDSMHPVFTPHPHSGRRTLYVNDFTARIAGVDQAASDELLSMLRAHAEESAPQYHHHWEPGDLLVWDNVGLQHRRDAIPRGQARRLRVFEGVAE